MDRHSAECRHFYIEGFDIFLLLIFSNEHIKRVFLKKNCYHSKENSGLHISLQYTKNKMKSISLKSSLNYILKNKQTKKSNWNHLDRWIEQKQPGRRDLSNNNWDFQWYMSDRKTGTQDQMSSSTSDHCEFWKWERAGFFWPSVYFLFLSLSLSFLISPPPPFLRKKKTRLSPF